jgi:hypothetical protein
MEDMADTVDSDGEKDRNPVKAVPMLLPLPWTLALLPQPPEK